MTETDKDPVLRRFGEKLLRLRTEHDLSQASLGDLVGVSRTLIGHLENARRKPDARLATRLDAALSAGGELEEVAADHRRRRAAAPYAVAYIDAVPTAQLVREYHPTLLPGLLQTEGYARAAIRAGDPLASAERVAELVHRRMDRQGVLNSPDPRVWTVVPEWVVAALDRHIRPQQVVRLVDLVEAGRVQVQVIPESLPMSMHPGLDGPYSLLTMPGGREVGYTEGVNSGGIITDASIVEKLSIRFSALQGVSLSPMESLKWLKEKV